MNAKDAICSIRDAQILACKHVTVHKHVLTMNLQNGRGRFKGSGLMRGLLE